MIPAAAFPRLRVYRKPRASGDDPVAAAWEQTAAA